MKFSICNFNNKCGILIEDDKCYCKKDIKNIVNMEYHFLNLIKYYNTNNLYNIKKILRLNLVSSTYYDIERDKIIINALYYAILNRNDDLVDLLLEYGYDIYIYINNCNYINYIPESFFIYIFNRYCNLYNQTLKIKYIIESVKNDKIYIFDMFVEDYINNINTIINNNGICVYNILFIIVNIILYNKLDIMKLFYQKYTEHCISIFKTYNKEILSIIIDSNFELFKYMTNIYITNNIDFLLYINHINDNILLCCAKKKKYRILNYILDNIRGIDLNHNNSENYNILSILINHNNSIITNPISFKTIKKVLDAENIELYIQGKHILFILCIDYISIATSKYNTEKYQNNIQKYLNNIINIIDYILSSKKIDINMRFNHIEQNLTMYEYIIVTHKYLNSDNSNREIINILEYFRNYNKEPLEGIFYDYCDSTCVSCMEHIAKTFVVQCIICKNYFHKKCMSKWFNSIDEENEAKIFSLGGNKIKHHCMLCRDDTFWHNKYIEEL